MLTSEWQKSSFSGQGGNCLEARLHDGNVQVRDSKDRDGTILTFTQREWVAFLQGVQNKEFDF